MLRGGDSAMPALPGFMPSANGLHFANSWPPGAPDYVFHIPPIGEVSIGEASNGLCGGMAFTVADLYRAHLSPPASVDAPAAGSVLFSYIAARLLASFNIPGGILTYYYWANTPDHDTGIWPVIRSGLSRMTITDQIPQITASINRGDPAALGLVTVRSFNPGDLGKCHQVLAYGYEWSGSTIRLAVYDPNSPNDDSVFISINTANPTHTTPIDSTVVSDSIRGFFYTQYSPMDPASIVGH
jgi:hypothetical protein